MSAKTIDNLLNRWFRDGQFRQLLRENPEQALAEYELSPEHLLLISNNRHLITVTFPTSKQLQS
jgi:hypothetical protein